MARKTGWQITKEVLSWSFLAVVLAIFGLQLLGSGRLAPSWKSFVIQSGSMEPSIRVGDVVFVQAEPEYGKSDVITFTSQEGRVVTHRILESGQEGYTTQGDANQTVDVDTVPQKSIIGKVQFVVPKLGYVFSFSKTPAGIIALIIIPATLLVADELGVLKRRVEKQ